jgi:hypothetical protein
MESGAGPLRRTHLIHRLTRYVGHGISVRSGELSF